MLRTHDRHVHINAKLSLLEKEVTDTFGRLFDLAPDEKVSKAAMVAALYPAKVKAEAEPVAALAVSRTFRQALEEWKAENRNLAKDSLRKYDQLATMMESWQPDLRPQQECGRVSGLRTRALGHRKRLALALGCHLW